MRYHSFYNDLLALLAVALMAAMAELSGQRAMIYPPIAALATGLLVADHRPWQVRLWQIPVLLTLGALIGTMLEQWLPEVPVVALLMAFLLTGMVLMTFRSTLFPTVATAMLPIILHLTTPLYPLTVALIAMMMVSLNRIAVSRGWKDVDPVNGTKRRSPLDRRRQWLLMAAGILPLLLMAEYGGHAALVAPPLMVVFATLCQPGNALRHHPHRLVRALILTTCCGVIGKEILLEFCGMPLFIVMPLVLLTAFTVLRQCRLLMPPLAALSLLPFVMNGPVWNYPFFALVGAGYLFVCSRTDWRVLRAVGVIRS